MTAFPKPVPREKKAKQWRRRTPIKRQRREHGKEAQGSGKEDGRADVLREVREARGQLAYPHPERKAQEGGRHGHRLRARRPRRLDSEDADSARLGWVVLQPCLLLSHQPNHRCWNRNRLKNGELRNEACHEGKTPGMSMRAPDDEAVPMCSKAHGWWTRHRGFFKGWTREQRRAWMDDRIAETQARYLSHGSKRG